MVEVEYGGDGYESPTEAVVDAVSAASRTDPVDLPRLYDAVDPDAFDQLFSYDDGGEAEKMLAFVFDDWTVFVRGDGRIRVCDPASETPSPVFE